MVAINIEIDENTLRRLVREHLSELVGFEVTNGDIEIQVKSKRNYKAEWEQADFRATLRKAITDAK